MIGVLSRAELKEMQAVVVHIQVHACHSSYFNRLPNYLLKREVRHFVF